MKPQRKIETILQKSRRRKRVRAESKSKLNEEEKRNIIILYIVVR